MTARSQEKKHLSARGLLHTTREAFKHVNEPLRGKQGKQSEIGLRDCLMSGLALFKLKFPSLLQFDQDRNEEIIRHNLKTLFRIKQAPSDTYLRERLDPIEPAELRPAFKAVFASLQRGKALEKYTFLDGHYLAAMDGTGYFSSKEIHCKNCCEKNHKDGTKTYYHQMLAATIVHPERREVIPLCPEPILKSDGAKKNDCERNAAARPVPDLRREHPHLPIVITEDALAANAPHIRLLGKHSMRYIIVVKPDGNKALFEWLNGEFKDGEQTYHNTWITDFSIDNDNAYRLVQGGRAKWKIESAPQVHKEGDSCHELKLCA